MDSFVMTKYAGNIIGPNLSIATSTKGETLSFEACVMREIV